eukprot:scaffold4164_cov190-Ochromonas_danica.AAC.5
MADKSQRPQCYEFDPCVNSSNGEDPLAGRSRRSPMRSFLHQSGKVLVCTSDSSQDNSSGLDSIQKSLACKHVG